MRTINRDILKLALPSILANITVPLVGMVDIAVAGHLDLNAAALIGGIAVGSMLFDLLYWNFGFLRIGTGGLAAQAYGRSDRRECARILTRALGIAAAIAVLLIAIQWVFVKAAFSVIECSPEVQALAVKYFHIRIWAAPATLSLMAMKGWFIGMQDSVSAMICDLVVNGMNILMSILLASFIGFPGIALGTVIAQWTGLLTAFMLLAIKYRKDTFSRLTKDDFSTLFKGAETRRFFVMNTDLFVRSLCFIAIYIGFTVISARDGDLLLAVSSVIMKLLMIFSYFTDGFAYAGEALTGRYVGAKDGSMVRQTIKWTFIWSMGLALIFMLIYQFAGVPMVRVMTSDVSVIEMSKDYLPWLLLMPVVGCAAFTWDGIYVGATASRKMRDSMLWAVVAFVSVWAAGIVILNQTISEPTLYNKAAMHVLMAAYFAHLLARTIYLTVHRRSVII